MADSYHPLRVASYFRARSGCRRATVAAQGLSRFVKNLPDSRHVFNDGRGWTRAAAPLFLDHLEGKRFRLFQWWSRASSVRRSHRCNAWALVGEEAKDAVEGGADRSGIRAPQAGHPDHATTAAGDVDEAKAPQRIRRGVPKATICRFAARVALHQRGNTGHLPG
jgi:hypothetical protein